MGGSSQSQVFVSNLITIGFELPIKLLTNTWELPPITLQTVAQITVQVETSVSGFDVATGVVTGVVTERKHH